jgi:hypothetical protein
MPYGGRLPITGVTGFAIGSLVIGQGYLLGAAAVLVATGAVLIRRTWRRNKLVNER